MAKKKTISIQKLIDKSNANLLFCSYVRNDLSYAIIEHNTIKNVLLWNNVYSGWQYISNVQILERLTKDILQEWDYNEVMEKAGKIITDITVEYKTNTGLDIYDDFPAFIKAYGKILEKNNLIYLL